MSLSLESSNMYILIRTVYISSVSFALSPLLFIYPLKFKGTLCQQLNSMNRFSKIYKKENPHTTFSFLYLIALGSPHHFSSFSASQLLHSTLYYLHILDLSTNRQMGNALWHSMRSGSSWYPLRFSFSIILLLTSFVNIFSLIFFTKQGFVK